MLILGLFSWIVCGIFAYALNFAHFQRHYPELARKDYWSDRKDAIIMGMFGPIGLLICLFYYEGDGLKWQ